MTRMSLALVVLLTGCATATPINRGADQPAEYFLECNGAAVPWSKCYARANQVCPRGYDTLEQATEHGPYTGAAAGGIASFGAALYKHMRIRCK